MPSLFSSAQLDRLGNVLEEAGFIEEELTKLVNFPDIRDFRKVINGHAKIVTAQHVVNTAILPYAPFNWNIENHTNNGQFEWDSQKVQFYLSQEQEGHKYVLGHKLYEEIKVQPVYNATILDYLLLYPELIPESWQDKTVFFWGTIYRDTADVLYVRCLYFEKGIYDWSWQPLYDKFYSSDPAAVAGK